MNTLYFDFDKKSRIWLYGAATMGVITAHYLEEQGYFVEGFIDKRADEIAELNGKPVLSLHQVAEFSEKEQIVVILTVKNVFEHERIAIEMVEFGINNIIFFPYRSLKGKGNIDENLLYILSNTISKRKEIDMVKIPKTFSFPVIELNDTLKISEDTEKIKVRLPFCLVYTDKDYKTAQLISQDKDETFLDINIAMLTPHIQFFKYLMGDESADYNIYLESCEAAAHRLNSFETTAKWKENVFRNRAEVFENMNKEYENKTSFFVESAPDAQWNSKGYFNLISGKHRASFLVSKGDWYIPVSVKKSEYQYLFNQEHVFKIKELIRQKQLHEIVAPVEHPMFANVSCYTSTFWYGTLQKVCFYMGNKNWKINENKKILVDVCDFGFLVRFFARWGAQVFKSTTKIWDEELETAINDLLCCPGCEYVDTNINQDYDYVITTEFPAKTIKDGSKAIYFLEQRRLEDHLEFINVGMLSGKSVFVYGEKE